MEVDVDMSSFQVGVEVNPPGPPRATALGGIESGGAATGSRADCCFRPLGGERRRGWKVDVGLREVIEVIGEDVQRDVRHYFGDRLVVKTGVAFLVVRKGVGTLNESHARLTQPFARVVPIPVDNL